MQDIKKNSSGDVIRVQKKEFKGKNYLDIRVFYRGEDGDMHPTKKGVSIPMELALYVMGAATKELEAK